MELWKKRTKRECFHIISKGNYGDKGLPISVLCETVCVWRVGDYCGTQAQPELGAHRIMNRGAEQ